MQTYYFYVSHLAALGGEADKFVERMPCGWNTREDYKRGAYVLADDGGTTVWQYVSEELQAVFETVFRWRAGDHAQEAYGDDAPLATEYTTRSQAEGDRWVFTTDRLPPKVAGSGFISEAYVMQEVRRERMHDRCAVDGWSAENYEWADDPGIKISFLADSNFESRVPWGHGLNPDTLKDLLALIPPKHRHHRVIDFRPYDKSPVPISVQEALIRKLPGPFDSHLRGWVMTGPPGTSKTAYASAVIIDLLTYNWSVLAEHARTRLHRVRVPQWLGEMQAWETRSFAEEGEGTSPKEPSVTPSMIESAACDLVPGYHQGILWLEELDKFTPTKTRINYLMRLIDAAYERELLIIVTTNATREELDEQLGMAITRRLFGDQEDPEQYLVWDLHAAVESATKSKPKPKTKLTLVAG